MEVELWHSRAYLSGAWLSSAGYLAGDLGATVTVHDVDHPHTVTGLTISAPGGQYVGLFGYVIGAQASVSNIGLVGGSMTGSSNVGSLLGWREARCAASDRGLQ